MPADLALLLSFDGAVYVGDLPVLAYARHCAGQLAEQSATDLIDGIRFFLEGRSMRDQPQVDLSGAQDGYHAVEILSGAMGLTGQQIAAAHRSARADLARSAFALEAPDGLIPLLTGLAGVHVRVVTNTDHDGVAAVLTAIGLAPHIDVVVTDDGTPGSMRRIVDDMLQAIDAAATPTRLMAVGDRWAGELAQAHLAGACTAMVDRFGRGEGAPGARAADMAGLIPAVRDWAQGMTAQGAATVTEVFDPAALPTPDDLPAEVPELVIAHLSDTHLTSLGVLYNGVIDPDAALGRAAAGLATAADDGRGPDVIVVSGDLTDSGDPDAYRRLHDALEPLAPQIIYATGNHDVRSVFHTELLRVPDRPGPILQVHRVGRVRVVVLDSTVVGAGHGVLTPDHLAELAAELAVPCAGGTVLVLHHAPLPPPSPLLTCFALDRRSRWALAAVVGGTDTRIILAGHHHLAGSGLLGGVPVAVAPSTAIRTDPLAPPGHERTFGSAGFNLVRLYPDGSVAVSVIPVDGAPEIFDLDETGCAAVVSGFRKATAGPPSSRSTAAGPAESRT